MSRALLSSLAHHEGLASRRWCTFTTPRTETRKDYEQHGRPPKENRGVLRHRTGDVLADRVDDADGMMGVRHPLTSTGAVRICTGKTE